MVPVAEAAAVVDVIMDDVDDTASSLMTGMEELAPEPAVAAAAAVAAGVSLLKWTSQPRVILSKPQVNRLGLASSMPPSDQAVQQTIRE